MTTRLNAGCLAIFFLISLARCPTVPAQESSPSDALPSDESGQSTLTLDREDRVGDCDFVDGLWTRSTLTGDWWGRRSRLAESGILFTGDSTQFAFGVNGGINAAPIPPLAPGDTFKYTGRGTYNLIFDLEKFGGLPYGKLLVSAEHWYGQFGNVSLNTGAFAPAVFAALLPPAPNDPGDLFMTNFVFTQPLSEKLVLFAGKKVVVGAADVDEFAGGNGTQQFMNQALIANPAFLLGLPYTSFTAGAAMPREWGMMTVFAYDPQDRTRDFFNGLGDLFSEGVIVGGEVKVRTNLFGKQGDQHVGAVWKHVEQTDLQFAEPPPGVYPQPMVPGFATLSNAYTLYYGFDQYLVQYADQPGRGYGLFGRSSISDGNPTPLRYFLSAGVGGYSPVGRQRGDQFGIGWYFVGATNEFGPLPQAIFGPRDGTGVEAYYNIQVNPWLTITPDVQYIHPGAGAIADDAFVYGLRVNMKL